jgi:polysaccharide pyruvyl transferase WcaK-like protein
MRYHFCLFSALQGVPFIAIERSDKVADLSWDLEWHARVAPSTLDRAWVIETGRELRQNAPELRNYLRNRGRDMRDRALRNTEALKALVLNGDGMARHGAIAAG